MFLPQVQLIELVEALVGVQAHFFGVKVCVGGVAE